MSSLSLMKRQARWTECFGAQGASFGMGWAERRATIGALRFSRAPTRRTECILQTPHLNYSAIAHSWLSALSSAGENELAVDLALHTESEADHTAA